MAGPGALTTLRKVASGLAGLFLFILALQILREGAAGLGSFVVNHLGVDSPWSAMGFGWIFAFLVLSGSPVAAIALSFYDSGVIDGLQTFTMIAGSRFGASFVVLFLGFLYGLRGRERGASLEMGVLSLLTTYAIYAVAVPFGALVLFSRVADGFEPALPPALFDLIDLVFKPLAQVASAWLPPFFVFALGVATILVAFHLFDKALPDLSRESPIQNLEAHVFRPAVMFGLGCAVTLLTLSVSVSLGLLVPLSAKGIARRENVIPYIMGANVTTFIDTLVATLFIERAGAFTVVLVEMGAVAAVSLFLLLFAYARFERHLLDVSRLILQTRTSLALFVLLILLVPILMLLL